MDPTASDQAQAATPEAKCDHICLKDANHVERGEPHFYGYENPSPRSELAELRAARQVVEAVTEYGAGQPPVLKRRGDEAFYELARRLDDALAAYRAVVGLQE